MPAQLNLTEHLVFAGHGAGDPGAGGNGITEAGWLRNPLVVAIKKYAKQLKKNKISFYDSSKNMYVETQKGWGAYSVSKNVASVTELHLDSASSSATGGHAIIYSGFNPDKYDLALAQVINKHVGWWGSVKNTKGINKRNDLLNLNVLAQRGISYRLLELGFISSKRDTDILKKDYDKIAKELVEAITGEVLDVAQYYDNKNNGALFELLKDDYLYNEMDFSNKTRRRVLLKKGTRLYIREFKKYGNIWRGRTAIGYITANKKYIKKV